MSESQFVADERVGLIEASLTALTISCSRAILMSYRPDRPRSEGSGNKIRRVDDTKGTIKMCREGKVS
jgi:hypothetical protein